MLLNEIQYDDNVFFQLIILLCTKSKFFLLLLVIENRLMKLKHMFEYE